LGKRKKILVEETNKGGKKSHDASEKRPRARMTNSRAAQTGKETPDNVPIRYQMIFEREGVFRPGRGQQSQKSASKIE